MRKWMHQFSAKMLENRLDELAKFVEPSCFGDLLAERTRWNPLKNSSANFHTHTLVKIQDYQIKFAATRPNLLMSFMFFGFGTYVISRYNQPVDKEIHPFLTLIAGIIFAGTGAILFYFGSMPVVFDKRKEVFWKGWLKPTSDTRRYCLGKCTELKNIYSVQIIAKKVKSNRRIYYNYEMNLVLKDASRINVICHGDKTEIKKDAEILAAFLDKPLWDAIELNLLDAIPLEELQMIIKWQKKIDPMLLKINVQRKRTLDRIRKHIQKISK